MLDVSQTLADRRVLFVGATGFVGKVALAMLLDRYPEIGKVFVLVRPGAGSTSEERFFGKVSRSPVFDPLRARHGERFEAYLRDKCVPLAGDAARPDLNFSAADFTAFGKIDLLINCAGLVSFSPSLETALRINTQGVRYVRDVARKIGAGVVHVSTCFVAGNRSGEIWEDEPVAGYYPRRGELRDEDFDVDAELADCERTIAQVKALADDRAHVSMFRDDAARRLRSEGRDPDDEKNLRIAVARERKLWVSQRLTELGMERAQHWGWPNIYTYTKSLGDQVLATATDVRSALVRPSIVESAVRFPFVGWNEGFTTTAPLVFLALKGHRTYPSHPKAMLDVVPVDLLASVIVAAGAAVVAGTNTPVYHASTSDSSPFPVPRSVELTSLYVRRHWKDRESGNKLYNQLRARLEIVPSSKTRFNTFSAPAWKGVAQAAQRWVDDLLPRWGTPRLAELADKARSRLSEMEGMAARVDDAFQLFMPFIHDNHYVFRSDNVRVLMASLTPADREKLVWDPEAIEWRDYWLKVHLPGLKKWVFPDLEEEFRVKPRSVYQYKELVELFEAVTKLHKSRTAMRQLPPPGSEEPVVRITYRELGERSRRGGAHLAEAGVGKGDRVLLVAENSPEWGMSFFATVLAGGVVVPVDHNAGLGELVNIARAANARAIVASERVIDRLGGPTELVGLGAKLLSFSDLFSQPATGTAAEPRGDDLASLLFTSGTTGNPKGVMLSHRNFTSLLAKLLTVFDLKPHDRLLSVLPLHHTFEFTAGFLMPLVRGAQITYLHEVNPDTIRDAFDEGDTTAMIGVPALWQLLHRRVRSKIGERGPWAEELFDVAVEGARRFRDATGINVGRVAFARVHRELGGRIRLMVSGGSALPPDVMKAFHGLGFSLYEGYGLTEASPVLAVQRPGSKVVPGSVGEALPGVELRIDQPDANGVGEVIASGPNVMTGYYENPEATREVLDGGWLRTGDLGRLDEEKRLYIVGRKKEMILAANGENVYPDELEELYRDSPWVKELSVVGLPEDAGETVACLLVPNYESGDRAEVRAQVHEHVRTVSAKLPPFKRIKVLHLWEHDLPRTSTRKVKRRLIVEELKKLQRAVAHAEDHPPPKGGGGDWVLDLVARVSARPRDRVARETRLGELGVDSLMAAELSVALDASGVTIEEQDLLSGVQTVGDLADLVAAKQKKSRARLDKPKPEPAPVSTDDLPVNAPLAAMGRKLLRWGQRMTYERFFDTEVTGRAYLPKRAPFIVAANHASHLDMGLVKHALGDWGELLTALAAKDYFFEDRLKRAYFENFTNLVPMDRSGSLRESLRLAADVLAEGKVLLIFPEGTRSPDGVMRDFKPSVGYLALTNKVDVVPMFLDGTYDALPKGAALPAKRTIGCHIGPLIGHERLRAATEGLPRGEHNRVAARIIEESVRKLGGLT